MIKSRYDDDTLYRALYTGPQHSKGDVKTRTQWNNKYMIDTYEHSDFERVKGNA